MIDSKENILVVDDTPFNLEIVEELLEDRYNTFSALDYKEAFTILQNNSIDLILLDIMMPMIDGYEACKRIKSIEEYKDIPIIFLTANQDEKSIENAYNVGGVDYIVKPFLPKELFSRIKTHLTLSQTIQQLEILATTDPMTGIYNRRKFFELAEDRFLNKKDGLYSVMVDIDKFKNINDTYGHQVGDDVIKTTTKTIDDMLPKNAIFGRLGGEEFAIVLNMLDDEELYKLVESIRNKIESLKIQTTQGILSFTISVGISSYINNIKDIDELLKEADLALYEAKGTGRNKSIFRSGAKKRY